MNIGERIGDYEVVSVLGAGGMGAVYKVRNVLSERVEAMKVLLPNLQSNAALGERFLREIKVQAALDHPNIAKLHTALTSGDRLLMVMEFVDGESLEALAKRDAISVVDAMRYGDQVLAALAYAHPRGVIHRDIKPGNIMVASNGAVKLMDFGIAKLKNDQKLTQTGLTVGSLLYMSPEQIQGNEPDARSDIYSLGVTMYEMVTHRRPFAGDSDYAIMTAHLQVTPPPPVEVVPGVPAILSDVIVMAMAKDPAGRFQSADAMRAALSRAMGSVPPPVAAAPQPAAAQVTPPTLPTQPIFSQNLSPEPAAPPPVPRQVVPPAPTPVPPAVAQPPKSRRALYMMVGSVVTLAIVAGLMIEGPKYMRTRAEANRPAASQPEEAQPPQASAPPPAQPATDASSPAPAPSADQSMPPAAAAPVSPTPAPVSTPSTRVQRTTAPPVTPRAAAVSTPVASRAAQPIPQAVPPAAQQVPPQQAPPPSAAPPVPSRAVMNEFREEHNDLAIRAATVRNGLISIQQQMSAQGVGLRGDIREAETRMNVQMKEAMESIMSGDPDGARKHLDYARHAIETIEKFLVR